MVPKSMHGIGCPPWKVGKWGGWKEHGLCSDSPTNLDWGYFNLFCTKVVAGKVKLQLLKHSKEWQNGTYSFEQEWHSSGKCRIAQWKFYVLPYGRHGIFKISRSYTSFHLVHRYTFSHQSQPSSHVQCCRPTERKYFPWGIFPTWFTTYFHLINI